MLRVVTILTLQDVQLAETHGFKRADGIEFVFK